MTPEPFVSAEEVVKFVPVKRRHLLALARKGVELDKDGKWREWTLLACAGYRNSFRRHLRAVAMRRSGATMCCW